MNWWNNWSKLFCALGFVGCLALRVALIFTNLDPESGFYSPGSALPSCFTVLLLCCLILIVGYGLLKSRSRFQVRQPKLLILPAALCGLGILAVSILCFRDYLGQLFLWNDPLDELLDNIPMALLQGLQLLLGLIAGASQLSLALSGGRAFRRTGILLCPALWGILYAIRQFMTYPQIADMPDRLLWLLTLLFFSLAMVGQARVLRQVDAAKGARYLNAYGYAAALCGLLLCLSQAVTLQRVSSLETYQWIFAGVLGLHCLSMALCCQDAEEER